MNKINCLSGYILTAVFGILTGGIAVAVLTRAVPEMMSRVMANMMGTMMAQAGREGCSPEEM